MNSVSAHADKPKPKWQVGPLEKFFRRSGLFRWPLKRHENPIIRGGLQDPWRGNAAAGAYIISNGIDWDNDAVDGNDFSWIRHLRTHGGSEARQKTRALISQLDEGQFNLEHDHLAARCDGRAVGKPGPELWLVRRVRQ
jgi:hypothetical protein